MTNDLSIVDVSRDGLPDVIGTSGGRYHLFINNGVVDGALSFSKYPIFFQHRDGPDSDRTDYFDGRWHFADWNGDSLPDTLLEDEKGSFGLFNSNNNIASDHLLSAANGLGKTVSFTYKPMIDTSVYTKDSGTNAASYPIIDLQQPSYLVSRLERSDGIGGLRTTGYHYTGAKADLLGRGFLGFREVASTDQQISIIQKSSYRQDYPFIGLIGQKQHVKNGITLSAVDTTAIRPPILAVRAARLS